MRPNGQALLGSRGIFETKPHCKAFPDDRQVQGKTRVRSIGVRVRSRQVAKRHHDRTKLMEKAAFLDFTMEIIRRSDTTEGFKILPRRWVVERTFGWMTRWRRLVRDYEQRVDCSQAMIHIAMGSLLIRRITHQ